MESNLKMRGKVNARLISGGSSSRLEVWGWRLRNYSRPGFIWGLFLYWCALLFSMVAKLPVMVGRLEVKLIKRDGREIPLGVASFRVVTTAFVNFVVDQLQAETSVFGDFKFHDSGVGTTAEDVGDTAIETTDGESRATGTQTEGASANIYKSVGTISYTSTKAITEHGLFNDASAGTLMDRSVFSAINVVSGDSIEFTYQLTCTAGG